MRRLALGLLLLPLLALPLAPALGVPPLYGDDPSQVGAWDEPFELPVQGEDAILLPTGKVLLFAFGSDAHLWDPSTGALEAVPAPEGINCAGLALLPDGRVLVNGGHNESSWYGSAQALLFDPWTKAWTKLPDMQVGRYYPGTITLADGRAMTVDGNGPDGRGAPRPEVWEDGAWRLLDASAPMEFYPRMHVVPGGDVVVASQQARAFRFDVEAETYEEGGLSAAGMRWGSVSALLPDLRTVVVAGGGSMGFSSEGWGSFPAPFRDEPHVVAANLANGREPATARVELLDVETLTYREAAPMEHPRRDFSGVLLPDGGFLVVGGADGFEPVPGWAERALWPELYDAAADAWTTMAPSHNHRGYHSTALLLPDGRVLASGGDFETGTGSVAGLVRTGEVFSPPYLFRGERPVLTDAPAEVEHGASFLLGTPDLDARAVAVRLSAVTHSLNTDQRVVPLLAQPASNGGLVAKFTDDEGAAPPGYYMIFLVSPEGVPSVARIVQLA